MIASPRCCICDAAKGSPGWTRHCSEYPSGYSPPIFGTPPDIDENAFMKPCEGIETARYHDWHGGCLCTLKEIIILRAALHAIVTGSEPEYELRNRARAALNTAGKIEATKP